MKRYHDLRPLVLVVLAAFGVAGGAAGQGMTGGTEQPPSPPPQGADLQIEARLITSYSLNKRLNTLNIGVRARHGVVTLTGKVRNDQDRDLAVRLARGVDGVRRVDDRLQVQPSTGPAR